MPNLEPKRRPNYIMNGNFDIWQRGTGTAGGTRIPAGTKVADRWQMAGNPGTGGTDIVSRQSFLTGQTDVPGNPTYFYRWEASGLSGTTSREITHWIEDVRMLAGKTMTIVLYARGNPGGENTWRLKVAQNMGVGGSGQVSAIDEIITVSGGSWGKIRFTFEMPTLSGATVGAVNTSATSVTLYKTDGSGAPIGSGTWLLDLAQMSLVEGANELPFSLMGGTTGEELSLCQRYYEKSYNKGISPSTITNAGQVTFPYKNGDPKLNDWIVCPVRFKVEKRTTPAAISYSPVTGVPYTVSTDGPDAQDGATMAVIGTSGFEVVRNPGQSVAGTMYFHWTADADF